MQFFWIRVCGWHLVSFEASFSDDCLLCLVHAFYAQQPCPLPKKKNSNCSVFHFLWFFFQLGLRCACVMQASCRIREHILVDVLGRSLGKWLLYIIPWSRIQFLDNVTNSFSWTSNDYSRIHACCQTTTHSNVCRSLKRCVVVTWHAVLELEAPPEVTCFCAHHRTSCLWCTVLSKTDEHLPSVELLSII